MLVMTKKMVPKVKYLQSIILLYEEFFPRNVQSVEKKNRGINACVLILELIKLIANSAIEFGEILNN